MTARLLDLFCKAGGAGTGYHQAGFDVVGVDIEPQKRYPFEFVQANALTLDPAWIATFDAVHASPPCQAHTSLRKMWNSKAHPDLIPQTRSLLARTSRPWIIENVPGSPLDAPFRLCGSMFGLQTECGAQLRRHRYFETNWFVGLQPGCNHHHGAVLGVYGGHIRDRCRTITVTGNTPQQNVERNRIRRTYTVDDARTAMGIDWMSQAELSQAIPPAYTRFLGERLVDHLSWLREAA